MIWLKKLTMDYVNNLEGTTRYAGQLRLGDSESDKRDVGQKEAYRLRIAEEDQFRELSL